jgi:acyl-CoA synthetase (AMP-forming)/AMP-acid ligase II
VRLRVDEQGEVLARSNHVMAGYWDDPEATAAAIDDGWLRTGDGGFLDDENLLTITDRKKDVILSGGENISSIEVEDCLYSHPDVREVAVIGVPSGRWGETVKALVVMREGSDADEAALISFARERMAHFKCPTSVELREALPRTATGKIQKFRLRAPYWEGTDSARGR